MVSKVAPSDAPGQVPGGQVGNAHQDHANDVELLEMPDKTLRRQEKSIPHLDDASAAGGKGQKPQADDSNKTNAQASSAGKAKAFMGDLAEALPKDTSPAKRSFKSPTKNPVSPRKKREKAVSLDAMADANEESKTVMPFALALTTARGVKLKNAAEWKVWRRSGEKPVNMPNHPEKTYAQDGWKGWQHFLGTTTAAANAKDVADPYEEAKAKALSESAGLGRDVLRDAQPYKPGCCVRNASIIGAVSCTVGVGAFVFSFFILPEILGTE